VGPTLSLLPDILYLLLMGVLGVAVTARRLQTLLLK
jgi:hypothetical protein